MVKHYSEIDQQAENEGKAIATLCRIRPKNEPTKHRQIPAEKLQYPRLRLRGCNMASEESKGEKFTRLANKRVNATISKIRLIGNLSSAQYGYTDDQVAKIEQALYAAVKTTMAQFNKAKIAKQSFEL